MSKEWVPKRSGDFNGLVSGTGTSVRLVLGDCLTVMRGFSDSEFDTIITDPPYNNGCKYATYKDSLPSDDYSNWCKNWYAECRRVADRVIIFPGPWNLKVWLNIDTPGSIGCWYKPGTGPVHQSSNLFQFVEWEPFLVYGGKRMGGSNVIKAQLSKKNPIVSGSHPCPKPLSLMIDLVKRVKGDSILDPFSGSGTTGVAAITCGKSFTGIEIDKRYFDESVFRLERVMRRYSVK